MPNNIVLATPHKRYDALEQALRQTHGFTVTRIRSQEELTAETLRKLNPDFVFFPHWSWIIPPTIFEHFPCVIFHMTDLPFGRGGSPLQNLIVRKITETKLSALRCEAGIDTGPVYLKMPLSLHGTAEEIFARAAILMESMIEAIVRHNLQPVPQSGEPTLFQRRKPEDGNLQGIKDLPTLYDTIRMLDAEAYPHAFLSIGGVRYEFTASQLSGDTLTATVTIKIEPAS